MHGGKIALYVIAILWTVVTLFPVVVTVMASFKTNSEIYLNLLSFPKKIMFQNYISANKTADALNTIKNSLVVATLTTVFNTGFLFLCSPAVLQNNRTVLLPGMPPLGE